MFFKQTSITAPWPIPSSRDTHTYLLSAHMQAAWRPKSEVKYFVLQRAKLCGSCAGDSHDAQWPHMHTIICWFCHLKSGAATVPTPSRHIWSSLKSSSYSGISLCGGMCVCVHFLEIMPAQQKSLIHTVDSAMQTPLAVNRVNCWCMWQAARQRQAVANSVATPRELAKSSAQGRMHMQLPRYCRCSSTGLLGLLTTDYRILNPESWIPTPDYECSSNCRCCCCCCCFWAINQRAKVKHWLTIQSTDLNWRIYLRNDCAAWAAPEP